MTYKAIIFDMDGVLVDTEHFYYQRRENFLRDFYQLNLDHLPPKFFIGGNMKNTWQAVLGDNYHKYDIAKLSDEYLAYKEQHPLPYQELLFKAIPSTLQKLSKAYPLALASSSSQKDIKRCLKVNQLSQYFKYQLSGDDFKESKPNPEIYLKAAQLLQVQPEECLVIEDSEKGIAAGKSAGMIVFAIKDYHYGLDQTAADQLIDSTDEIFRLI
ncbi:MULTISPECIES: HAD family phosphatase [unclassified Enterococcus]|uniref:HAD family hydrolase n=1 Tax=unclassified Enterococcus TaxID=2608891 RepID=UPI001557867C|nr:MULTISPECIES: HAD family phosphatase [unclassified Enterococcus]MBS7578077.1 HAD family phosphatase [Enterococcus sp. MMGLQ5-2]MBS7585337.1 HAD family phosphatase [Enterococcus sp. MMGLQ5-1]NPD13194.1 HAD family phosphatase [Enterococcus sp. MMGLQ5-1]NPD37908.1 HAD family phosphatase [Enterococcus sp. MMGLQ5-2]